MRTRENPGIRFVKDFPTKRMGSIGTRMADNEWCRGEFRITTDQGRLHLGTIYAFLANQSEWAKGIGNKFLGRHEVIFEVMQDQAVIRQEIDVCMGVLRKLSFSRF